MVGERFIAEAAVEKPQPGCYFRAEGVTVLVSSLRKLLWMFVALAAMVLLAPMPASAHESHPRAVAHVSQHNVSQHHASAPSEHGLASKALDARVAQPSESDGSVREGLCTTGCCFGMGCCAGTIVSEIPAVHPPSGLSLLFPPAMLRLISAPRSSLLEPPNALA